MVYEDLVENGWSTTDIPYSRRKTFTQKPSILRYIHMPPTHTIVSIDNRDTWTKYRLGLCNGCQAFCCRMPVEATLTDLIRIEVVDPFDAQGRLKRIAWKLKQQGIIEHYNLSQGKFTLARRPNLDCTFWMAKVESVRFMISAQKYAAIIPQLDQSQDIVHISKSN